MSMNVRRITWVAGLILWGVLGGGPIMAAEQTGHIRMAVDSPLRSAENKARDERRKPAEILKFFGVEPGMKIVEIAAGGGYYTEILSLAVGEGGRVIAHTPPFLVTYRPEVYGPGGIMAQKYSSPPWNKNVVYWVADLSAPDFPMDQDMVTNVLFYHDTVWQKTDRAAMNRAIYDCLKPGGIYAIIDHSAQAGSGGRDVKSLHRIDKALVIHEVTAARFELVAESDLLAHPEDSRDYNVFRDVETRRDATDRFVLKFRKPVPPM